MKKRYFICVVLVIVLNVCKDIIVSISEIIIDVIIKGNFVIVFEEIVKSNIEDCRELELLLWEGEGFVFYMEDRMRGKGVIFFIMDINDRLDIFNEDDSNFGEIVLNEGLIYFIFIMFKKIVVRKVIVIYDFVVFDFDCESIEVDWDYFIIYVNKEKRKVKKLDFKYIFLIW